MSGANDAASSGSGAADAPRQQLRSTMSQVELRRGGSRPSSLGNGSMEELVQRKNGKRVITKILIANNGIAGMFKSAFDKVHAYKGSFTVGKVAFRRKGRPGLNVVRCILDCLSSSVV
jgi:hypothetical protein